MTRDERILALFKFGARNHMEELVRDGHLYMRPLSRFVIMEADALRADTDEGLAQSIPADGWEFSVAKEGRWEPVGTVEGALRFTDIQLRRANVYCMHAFLGSRVPSLIDSRNLAFGDTFVVFTDGNEFLRRVKAELARLDLSAQSGLVEYIDPLSYRGPMGIFRKVLSFSYQAEYRLAILPGTGEPYSLRIGSLSDIASIGPLARINEHIRIIDGGVAEASNV